MNGREVVEGYNTGPQEGTYDGQHVLFTEVRFETTVMWYDPLPGETEPDGTWKYVDNNGHGHFATQLNGNPRVSYPTLVEVEEDPGDDEHPRITHMECKICQEIILPGRKQAAPFVTDRRERLHLKMLLDGFLPRNVTAEVPVTVAGQQWYGKVSNLSVSSELSQADVLCHR